MPIFWHLWKMMSISKNSGDLSFLELLNLVVKTNINWISQLAALFALYTSSIRFERYDVWELETYSLLRTM